MSLLVLLALAHAAPRPVSTDAGELIVEAPRPMDAPCATVLNRATLLTFPGRANEELLRVVPGMVATSRLGFGGAWSYAWRGFDMAHGHDLAVSVEDAPLNEPSHTFSPGMFDLTFVPRILIDSVDACSGGAPATDGAFGTAGAVRFQLGLPREGTLVQLHTGTDGSGAVSIGWRPPRWDRGTWVVAEVDGGEGTQGFRTYRHLRLSGGVEGNAGHVNASAFVMLYDGLMDVPEFLREDEVASNAVDFYGSHRSWKGSLASRRLLFSGRLVRPWSWGSIRLAAWAGGSGFRLRDNRTGYLENPDEGDATELRQPSGTIGLRGDIQRTWKAFGDMSRLEAGIDLRAWFQHSELTPINRVAEPIGDTVERRQQPSSLAFWTAGRLGISRIFTLQAQLRLEEMDVRVLSLTGERSFRGTAWMAAPQATVSLTPSAGVQVYGRWARGYRPFDGRMVDTPGRLGVSWTDTVEAGIDTLVAGRFRLSGRGFAAWTPQETIYDPWTSERLDVTSTRRVGGEGRITFAPSHAVRVEVDGAGVDARDLTRREVLPYVPPWSASVGVFLDHRAIGPVYLSGGLRAWVAAPRTLPGGFHTHAQVGADLTARVSWRQTFFDLAIDQVVPFRKRDAEDVFASDWTQGAPSSQLVVPHLIAGPPFTVRIGFGLEL